MKNWFLTVLLSLCIFSAFSQNAYFTYNKGCAQLTYENYEAAVKLFTEAIAEKPDFADAYANRGIAYHKSGQYDKAIADYIKDNSLVKDRSTYNLACVYALLGKKDEAVKAIEQCQKSTYKQVASSIDKDPDFDKIRSDPTFRTILVTDYFTPYERAMIEVNEKFDAKDYEAALVDCDKAISLNNTDKRVFSSKAYILVQLGKYDQAMIEYNKMIQLDATDYEAFAGKANMFYQQKKYAEALEQYETAEVKNPAYMPLYETGMSKYATGRKDEGIADLKKYCKIYTKDDLTMYTCAQLLHEQQKDTEAWTYIQNAISLNQATPEYYLLQANLSQTKKNWADAITDYTKVITLDGNDKGEAYYKRGICRTELYAKTKSAADKKAFCEDMAEAKTLGIKEAMPYLKELCK